jgi:D-alanyl-D-alanine carboxypeptidase
MISGKFGIAARLLPVALFLATVLSLALPYSSSAADRQSAIIIDVNSRAVLFAEAPDAQRYPASLTKMMTLYLTFDALDRGRLNLGQKLTMSQHAATQAPSVTGLRAGESLTVEQAIMSVTTKSANDAAVALGEAVGGSEDNFAHMMTQRAASLGMSNSVFRNASGLPNRQQHTTARDMATLALALWNNHRPYYHYFSVPEITIGGRTLLNHNHLLGNYEGADGIKTGYIRDSGFNLVASAERDNRRLVGVVFGGTSVSSRDHEMAQLLDRGFAQPNPNSDLRSADRDDEPDAKAMKNLVTALNPVAAANAAEAGTATEQGSTSAESDSWAVQVGAFNKAQKAEHQAQRAIKAAPKALQADKVSIEANPDDSGKLFRARVAGLTEQEARDACRQLHRKKFTCQAIAPN